VKKHHPLLEFAENACIGGVPKGRGRGKKLRELILKTVRGVKKLENGDIAAEKVFSQKREGWPLLSQERKRAAANSTKMRKFQNYPRLIKKEITGLKEKERSVNRRE